MRLTDKYGIYLDAFCNTLRGYTDVKKLIVYGVKIVNAKPKSEYIEIKEAEHDFQFATVITDLMRTLTPKEFMNLYPITKTYDGDKYECKDYFYTINYIKGLNQEQPIGKEIIKFLWEYQNWEINFFNVACMGYMDNIRRLEGKSSFVEEFADIMGFKSYNMHTDDKGNEFLFDKKTGKTTKLNKNRPKYLKVMH